MSKGVFQVPEPINEPILPYSPGSPEKATLKAMISELRSKVSDIPMIIGCKEIRTGQRLEIRPPHDLKHLLGYYYMGDKNHVVMAIDAALEARSKWQALPWHHRASIFLKAP